MLYDYIKKPRYYDDGAPPADMWRDWTEEMRSIRVPGLPDLVEGGVAARGVPLGAVPKL